MKIDLNIFDGTTSPLQAITARFFDTGWKDIQRLYGVAVSSHLFSNKSNKEFDHIQDLLFLYALLYLLNWERQDILESTGTLPTREAIYKDYDLDAIRKYFACNFIEIIPLLAEFDTAIPIGDYDGIGYMYIQQGDSPEFLIS